MHPELDFLIHCQHVPYGSPEYIAACRLREVVLREPIGMVLRPQDVAGEEQQWHFAALDKAGIVGTVTFKPLEPTHCKLRQMAVADHLHGQGIGAALVLFAEDFLHKQGFRSIETSAREVAIGFYAKLGYRREGDFYEEVGLRTIRMVKTL